MSIGLFPIRYFGNLAYFRSLFHTKTIVFEKHEHFYKQQAINRFSILSANGPLELTVPVSKPKGSKTPIKDLIVSFEQDWVKNHLKSIESAYSSAPHFEFYMYDIVRFLEHPPKDLLSLNLKTVEMVNEWLDLSLCYQFSLSHEVKGDFNDFRTLPFTGLETSPTYTQVFSEKTPFTDHLSILDLIFNEGPLARNWITRKD